MHTIKVNCHCWNWCFVPCALCAVKNVARCIGSRAKSVLSALCAVRSEMQYLVSPLG
jgi:hypothetical protein